MSKQTTPLLLLDLALFAGVSPIDIISLVVFDILSMPHQSVYPADLTNECSDCNWLSRR